MYVPPLQAARDLWLTRDTHPLYSDRPRDPVRLIEHFRGTRESEPEKQNSPILKMW